MHLQREKQQLHPKVLRALDQEEFRQMEKWINEYEERCYHECREKQLNKFDTLSSGQLPFLDVLVKRKGSNLTTSVYRNPTSTVSYLNYQSNHHPAIKLGTITCLKKRAHNICSQENLQEELQHLQSVFEKSGYPRTSRPK